jgi:hypothetical protein
MKILKIFSFIFLSIIVLNFISAANLNVTRNDAALCLNESIKIMYEMSSSGFNVLRVNDSLKQAQLLYDSKVVLLSKKQSSDFSIIIPYCDEIKKVRELAISAKDEFEALLIFYNESIVKGMNTASIDKIIDEIKDEMKNERYENVKALTDKGYNEIIDVKSSYTALNLFLDSTTKGLLKFIKDKWKIIVSVIVVIVILFLVYRIKIIKWLLERQLSKLQLRKKTIQDLIMKIQREYFEVGKMSESEYNIKTKKFAELILDIDRQVPLIKEELIKVTRARVRII